MYGYVIINQSELKFKEFELYRSYYCGFCRKLREKYGFPGQMTLSYPAARAAPRILLSAIRHASTNSQITRRT